MHESYFDAPVADHYDQGAAEMFRTDVLEPAVDLLEGLADGGPVPEFAIGTGRVVLPLARRGLEVVGIDLSSAMVA